MVQEFNYLKNELDFQIYRDQLFRTTQDAIKEGRKPSFKRLLEAICSETVIVSAIHKIKANRGSKTAGSDGRVITDILQKDYTEVIRYIRDNLNNYRPQPVRRVWIPKPGKKEKRPLGIPAIADRVIQEMVRSVIEPILEAQFFKHSYGFRPMRDASMALARTNYLVNVTGYRWIVEGDISKFFDNVNHRVLLKKLYSMGIRDRRVLMIIKAMLKAGIMEEMKTNELGTPQGGNISPLLANVYLHQLDKFVTREWEDKRTRRQYSSQDTKLRALKRTNLKPAYLVRYADDWILITETKSNAEKWKRRIQKYLGTHLKLELSDEKTKVTNITKKPITFVGFDIKGKRSNGPRTSDNYRTITISKPNSERLEHKIKELHRNMKKVRFAPAREVLVHNINLINSQVRGIANYYRFATHVNIVLNRYSHRINYAAFKSLKVNRHGGKWVPANKVNNLLNVHSKYSTQIPAIEYQGMKIGITSPGFVVWEKPVYKNQDETPYSIQGRSLYQNRTGKKPVGLRADELIDLGISHLIARELTQDPKYNFEYLMNRVYAYNRDKGKCRVCGKYLSVESTHTHHIDPNRPLNLVNNVGNLASVHYFCHTDIHNLSKGQREFETRVWKKIAKFREKLTSK